MQRLKEPQMAEVLLQLLVQSRYPSTGVAGATVDVPNGKFEEPEPQGSQQAKTVSSSGPPLPLQVLAASATLGRPLHRYLANLTRWKQQQLVLLQAREPPLEGFPFNRFSNDPQPSSLKRWQPVSGAFATPQQRMKAAFERLADRGLLGLPRLPRDSSEPPQVARLGLGMDSPPNAFKAVLPIIRSADAGSMSPKGRVGISSSVAPQQSPLSVGTPGDAFGQPPLSVGTPGDAFGHTATHCRRRGQTIPSCISHALFPVPDNSAETLAAAAADVCSRLRPRRALLLLQDGSSLRTLQLYMNAQGHKVDLLCHTNKWWRTPRVQQQGDTGQVQQPQELLAATMQSVRGLHVAGAEVLILLGRVKNVKDYIHLAGRVGRCGQDGLSVAISDDATQRVLLSWQKTLGITFGAFESLLPSDKLAKAAVEKAVPRTNPTRTAQSQQQMQQHQHETVATGGRQEAGCNLQRGSAQGHGGETQLDRSSEGFPRPHLPSLLLN